MTQPRPIYLDCNATTPVEEKVIEAMTHFLRIEYGNAGSRTHRYGAVAAQAVRLARERVAAVVNASWEEVVFTSGATESNNLAIFGVASEAEKHGRRHIISTQIEHKAVLEPLEELSERGFEVTLLPPDSGGAIHPDVLRDALRDDTCLVSIMHVNNETGVIQPIELIAGVLDAHPAVFHTDSAQGFGKELSALQNNRVDLISVSAHKIYGPKGVGALIVRAGPRSPRLPPLMYGGGQERGVRPGTVPVHLVAGLGVAAEMALNCYEERRNSCLAFRKLLLEALAPLSPVIHGHQDLILPNVVNIRFGEIDSEAVMIALKDYVAISNGSACTSSTYEPSHVLNSMGLTDLEAQAATRWSWSHMTPAPDWQIVKQALETLR